MDLGLEKVGFAVAILVAAWIGGIGPLARGASATNPRFLSWGNAFAAGIFLSIGFVHMLSDAVAQFHDMGESPTLVFFLAAVAFVFMLLLEHVLLPSGAHEHLHAEAGTAHAGFETAQGWNRLYPYALIAALSIHSIFAGIALGVQENVASTLLIFIAIVAHKATASFALSVSLVRQGAPRYQTLRLIVFFSVMTPLGIAMGDGIHEVLSGESARAMSAVVVALAAGTFIYIAALDLIRDEFLRPGSAWVKWCWTALGLVFMSLLALWI